MTKILRQQLEKLEDSKENCRIYLAAELNFFGKIWQIDDEFVELIAFTREENIDDLATTSSWIIPIDRIVALGYASHSPRIENSR